MHLAMDIMSSGYYHAKATKKVGLVFTALNLLLCSLILIYQLSNQWLALLLGAIVGLWLGHLVTPDYDVNQGNYIKRKLIIRYGLLGKLWALYWLPYAIIQPHRGISHTWPKGTFLRYLLTVWPLIALLSYLVFWLQIDWLFELSFLIGIFSGQSLQDWVHLFMDR